MAGSYKHVTKPDGSFNAEDFGEMIENLGDAYEACEEMHFMVSFLAGGDRERIAEAHAAFVASQTPGNVLYKPPGPSAMMPPT